MERAEYVLSGALVAAVQSRNVPALQEAIAAAEAVKDPTMQKDICGGLEEVLLNSPPMLQAKHMLELLTVPYPSVLVGFPSNGAGSSDPFCP